MFINHQHIVNGCPNAEIFTSPHHPSSHLPTSPPPKISILKPLKALDEQLTENLTAFLNLEGSPYEVLIGIADINDPVVALVKEFIATHPQAPILLIITGQSIGCNPKVMTLASLEKEASGDILLVSDGNTRPHRHCLKPILTTFENPNIGVASAPFFVRQPKSIGAKFRALRIGTMIVSSICGGYTLTKFPFIVGKWMAIRREALVELGGFAALSQVLCEDAVIAPKLHQLNWKAAIIPDLIDIYLGDWTIKQAWSQQLRWSRLIRFIAFVEPILELLWNGVFLLLASAIAWKIGAKSSALNLAIASLLNWIFYSTLYIKLGGSLFDILLLPLQDFQMLLIAISTYFGNEINWRGQRFRISKGGKIEDN
ncbi:MAG: glycosyltransferase [Heteroscytonema crispum UTEX LB 1556]